MLNKLSVKNLIEFLRLTERGQIGFAQRLKTPKEPKPSEGGGDYWIPSISGLSNAFKVNNNLIIKEKLGELLGKQAVTKDTRIKQMYQRNIDILYKYEDFDFSAWRPKENLKSFSGKSHEPINVKSVAIGATPHQVFTFGKKETQSIGAIKFVVWQNGFKTNDLASYSEAIYLYLTQHHSSKYIVDPNFCLTIDISNKQTISYNQVLRKEISSHLNTTLDLLNKYLR